MPPRNKEVKPVVPTSFPDLLGEEEARVYRENYPSEVTIANKTKRDDAEADGLLDALLNDDVDQDDDTLTNSCDDCSEDSTHGDISREKAEFKKPKDVDGANQGSLLGGLLSFSSPSSSASNSHKTPKRVTYADDVKILQELSDDTSRTESDRSSGRDEEEEEAIVIVDDDEEDGNEAGQEVEFLEETNENQDDDEVEQWDEEWDNDNHNNDDDDDDASASSFDSNTTQDLLERAHDRLNMQGLFEEVGQLRNIIEKKDKEIDELSGQLRRAVATKCDLVIAHTELERHHEFNLKQLEEATKQLVKANFGLVEDQACTDVVSVGKQMG